MDIIALATFFMDAYHPVKSVVENIFYFHKNELKAVGINTEIKF